MRWKRRAAVGLWFLLCVVTVVFYSRILIHGGVFRRYLINNALMVWALSLMLVMFRFLHLKAALWLTGKFNRWQMFWAGLGLLLPILLYPIERFTSLDMGEPFLFTLWPTNIMFMAMDGSWSGALLIVPLSLAVNATIYVGISALFWWLVNLFFLRQRPANTTI